MTQLEQQLEIELRHILDSGVNYMRILELCERFSGVSKWIPVEESLPEIDERVLGFYKLGEFESIDIFYIDSITLMGGGRKSVDWHNHDHYDPGITHWHPLPKNPGNN